MDMTPKKADGTDWENVNQAARSMKTGNMTFQRVSLDGAYSDRIQWLSKGTILGWQTAPKDSTPAVALKRGDFWLKKGEALIITYQKDVACNLQASGAVELQDQSFLIPANQTSGLAEFHFIGNNTPIPVDVTDIQLKKADGTDWENVNQAARSIKTGNMTFQMISLDGAYENRIQWLSKGTILGWQTAPKDSTPAAALKANDIVLNPGEGMVVTYQKDVACKIILPNPVK